MVSPHAPVPEPTPGPCTFVPSDLAVLEKSWMPAWVFDAERLRMVWANAAGLELWGAADLAEFLARDFTDISDGARTRLALLTERIDAGEQPIDQWTFYPKGRPVTARVRRSAIGLPDGRRGMLHEAQPLDSQLDPAVLRAVEALHHTNLQVSLYAPDGRPVLRNPAAERFLGRVGDAAGSGPGGHFRHAHDRADLDAALDAGAVFSRVLEVETLQGPRWHGLDARVTVDPVTGGRAVLVNERDVSETKALESSLRERETFLRAVLDVTPNPTFVHSEDGRFVLLNQANIEVLGGGEIEGRMPEEVAPPEVAALWRRENSAILDTGQELARTEDMQLADGSQRTFRVVKRRVVLPDGRRCVVGTAVDITDLTAARRGAEAAAAAKSRFLAMMSHEIRTPLTAVLGFAEVLRRDERDPDRRNHLEMLSGSADTLLRILDDVLDMAKIEAGRMEVSPIDTDLHHLASAVVGLFAPRAEDKGLELRLRLAPGTPVWVRLDPSRLRQILSNLIGNAIKFTERGSITLSLGAQAERLTIDVADTGIGIAAEALERLFQPFTQADASTARRFGGTGLGLTISHGLARTMGGSLEVVSRPGEGSRFILSLPLVPGRPPPGVATTVAGTPARRARILLADDTEVNRLLVTAMLGRMGHSVDAVSDGAQAVAAVRAGSYDLVLMDVWMPVLDGLAATRTIRALPGAVAAIRIIALTADAMPESRAACAAAGMDACLTKPIDWAALGREIERLWDGAATP